MFDFLGFFLESVNIKPFKNIQETHIGINVAGTYNISSDIKIRFNFPCGV